MGNLNHKTEKKSNLRLRKLKIEDLEIVRQWRMLPEVTKYMYTDPVLTMEDQIKWYDNIKNDNTKMYWVINYADVDIGVINLADIDYKNQRCGWGYYIADLSFRGKGIVKTLECNMYDYVFYKLGLNKLCSDVFDFNETVINIHKKFGSFIEGVSKEHIIKNGKKYDVVLMAINKETWEKIRENFIYDVIEIE